MKADTVLDYAVFDLSPKHSRKRETGLASGFIEPFVNHLRVLESQASKRDQSSVRLEVEKNRKWLILAHKKNTRELEAARTLYSQDNGGVADATNEACDKYISLPQ
ncbi:unnamed protein product [Arabidopsis halleri]